MSAAEKSSGPGPEPGTAEHEAGHHTEASAAVHKGTTSARHDPAPSALTVIPDGIPAELRSIRRWVLWRWQLRDKWTKPPYTVRGGSASTTDPRTWTAHTAVLAAYQAGGWSGIGLVLTDDDDLAGIDLDHCRDPDSGRVEPWALEIAQTINSYTEASPSGTGLRIIVRAKLPAGGRKRGNVEVYESGRYLTITGHRLDGAPETVEHRQAEVEAFHAEHFPAQPKTSIESSSTTPELSDRAVLDLAYKASNAAKIKALYDGDNTGHNDDPSAADLALIGALSFYTQDEDQLDRLFRGSPRMRDKWDESHFADGSTYGAATIRKALSRQTETYTPPIEVPETTTLPGPAADPNHGSDPDEAEDGQDRKASQATLLVRLAEARYRLGVAASGEPFAVPHNGAYVARMLRGGRDSLRAELSAAFAGAHGRVPASAALADAMLALEGRALAGERVPLALRVAGDPTRLVIDLGDATGRAVVIDPDGWTLVDRSPVLFRRSDLSGALPTPERGGDLAELRALLNVTAETWPLLLAWLVAALIPELPHPIVLLTGEHGVGKSTTARFLAGLIDPSPAQLRTSPRDVEAWAVAASGSWVVALDNVSAISAWLSDALCRSVTGDGMVRRRLYSDDQLSVLAFRRVTMLTSIDAGGLRGDLADRLLTVECDRIPAAARRLDDDLARRWTKAHPRILGALLDLTVRVLAELPDVRLRDYPRMADFARVVAATDAVLGTDALTTYRGQAGRIAADVVDADPVAAAVRSQVDQHGPWEGSAGELLAKLTPDRPDRPPKDWPASGQAMAGALKRAAPALRSVGLTVEYDEAHRDARGRRLWRFTKEGTQTTAGTAGLPEQASDQHEPPGTLPGTLGTEPPDCRESAGPEQASDQHSGTPGTLGTLSPPPSTEDKPSPGELIAARLRREAAARDAGDAA